MKGETTKISLSLFGTGVWNIINLKIMLISKSMITPGVQMGVKVDIVGCFFIILTRLKDSKPIYQTRNCFCLFACQQRVNYNFEDAF